MQPSASVSATSVIIFLVAVYSSSVGGAPNDGKYNPKKYGKSGKYVHSGEGEYKEDVSRYRYVHYDDGDRGRYFHIHIPYDGGYGNYEGGHEPYRYPPYDPAGEYAEIINKYSSDPFRANSYDIKKPSIYLEYGVPAESNSASSVVDVRKSLLSGPGTAYLPVPEPDLDVRKSLLPGLGTAYLPVLTPEEQKLASGSSERKETVLPHPNSVDRNTNASAEKDHNGSVEKKENSSTTIDQTGSGEKGTATANPNDAQTGASRSPTSNAKDDSLHNQPCILAPPA